nr:hypothetical protein [Agrobacterium sp. rho-8.1]
MTSGIEVQAYGLPLTALVRLELRKRVPAAAITEFPEQMKPRSKSSVLVAGATSIILDPLVSPSDIRRASLALIAKEAAKRSMLLVHGVAVEYNGLAVLLIGPHAAGKTTVSLELKARGWRVLAGDTVILSRKGEILAGSRAILIRKDDFGPPSLQVEAENLSFAPDRWELEECEGGPYQGVKIVAIADLQIGPKFKAETIPYHEAATRLFEAAQRIFDRSKKNLSPATQKGIGALDKGVIGELTGAISLSCDGVRCLGDPGLIADALHGLAYKTSSMYSI